MLWAKVLAGALIGAAAGVLLGRAKVCRSEQCSARNNLLAGIVAMAVFGAAVAYYLSTR